MRKTRFLFLSAVLTFPAVLLLAADQFRSTTANIAMIRYEESVTKASARYYDDEKVARKKLIRALEVSLVGATKSGDLEEANKLKAAIVRYELMKKGKPQRPQLAASLKGNYRVQYPGGKPTPYRFGANGSAVIGQSKARVVVRGGALWLDAGDNDANRITLLKDGFFIEHWRGGDTSGFPHSIGIGVKVK